MSLNDSILHYMGRTVNDKEDNKIALYEMIHSANLPSLRDTFHSFFASIPHDWYRKNNLANYEGYYISIFYCYFTAIGLDVRAEDTTNHGQIDLTVILEDKVYVFEFKVIELTEAGSALEKIKEKKYYEKFIHELGAMPHGKKRKVVLVGVEFSKEDRSITNFEWEELG